ncbi:MAG: hypothetical protein V4611_02155 [Patescibacteria group bacterium]
MKKIRTFIAAFILIVMSAFVLAPVATVGAQAIDKVCSDTGSSTGVCAADRKNDSADDLVKTIVNTLLFVVGALSVVMIIVGGVFYTTSAGDSSNVTKAKNTILYAVVGLVVSFLAYALVNWVIGKF